MLCTYLKSQTLSTLIRFVLNVANNLVNVSCTDGEMREMFCLSIENCKYKIEYFFNENE